jgi:pimeloyl-ACP methyl ester carboxylesterase
VKTEISLLSGSVAVLDTHASRDARDPTVLLVPGYTGSKEDFEPLLGGLADVGYRAVAIDQRGQYESEWSADPDGYRLAALAADVVELGRRLRASAPLLHLLGHSFGGLVVRAAAIREPATFDSLTLMGSGPSAIGGERRRMLELCEPMLAEDGLQAVWDATASRSAFNPYARTDPGTLQLLRTRFFANDPVGLAVMGAELQTVPDRTAELAIAYAGKPVLVLHGVDDDAWPPTEQQRMAEALRAELCVISRAAHSPAVENPSETLRGLVSFWDRAGRARSTTD